jgi:hypothetical protein
MHKQRMLLPWSPALSKEAWLFRALYRLVNRHSLGGCSLFPGVHLFLLMPQPVYDRRDMKRGDYECAENESMSCDIVHKAALSRVHQRNSCLVLGVHFAPSGLCCHTLICVLILRLPVQMHGMTNNKPITSPVVLHSDRCLPRPMSAHRYVEPKSENSGPYSKTVSCVFLTLLRLSTNAFTVLGSNVHVIRSCLSHTLRPRVTLPRAGVSRAVQLPRGRVGSHSGNFYQDDITR